MVAHELATLNDTREENIALKRTAESLRKRNATLLERNGTLENTIQGTTIALNSLFAAMKQNLTKEQYTKITNAAKVISGAPQSGKQNKRNRPLQVVQ